jgi:hypothetical protein
VAVTRELNPLFVFWLTLLVNHNGPPPPRFFKSVDFKGTLSCLGSTLLEVLILEGLGWEIRVWKGKLLVSADSKRVRKRKKRAQASRPNWVEKDRAAGEHGSDGRFKSCPLNETIITYFYDLSIVNYKCFGCSGIARADLNWA